MPRAQGPCRRLALRTFLLKSYAFCTCPLPPGTLDSGQHTAVFPHTERSSTGEGEEGCQLQRLFFFSLQAFMQSNQTFGSL